MISWLYQVQSQTNRGLPFSLSFPGWYFCAKDLIGIVVLGLWDHVCWCLIWLSSVVPLPHWHPGTWHSSIWLPVTVYVSTVAVEWRQDLCRASSRSAGFSSPGAGRLVWHFWAWRFEISAQPLCLWHPREPSLWSHPTRAVADGAGKLCMTRASQSSPWDPAPSLATPEPPNSKTIPSTNSFLLSAPTQTSSKVSCNLSLFCGFLFSFSLYPPTSENLDVIQEGWEDELIQQLFCWISLPSA